MILSQYLDKKFFLPFLTLSISLVNFFFVVNITNFLGPTRLLDLNFVIYGIVIFISGQLGTLLSNSYIPYVRQKRNEMVTEFNEIYFLSGFFIFTSFLAAIFTIIGLFLSPDLSALIIFYGFFLFLLLVNQFISLRILEVKENYLNIQLINFCISLISLIAFFRISHLGLYSISFSLFVAQFIGLFFLLFQDNYKKFFFSFKNIFDYLIIFLTFLIKNIKAIIALSIFAVASLIDPFFLVYLKDGEYSLHTLSMRIIIAATSTYYASFGIIFTNDISKNEISSKEKNSMFKKIFFIIILISILSFSFLLLIHNNYEFWSYFFNIPESKLNYFSNSLLYNSLLIFPMLFFGYYFRYNIANNQNGKLLTILFSFITTYILSIILFKYLNVQYILQFSLFISWWLCVFAVLIYEFLKKVVRPRYA